MEYRVEEDGYVKVEVINEDRQDVYFDDFRVAFSGLQVLEENHLYPYGKQQQEPSYVIDGAGPYRHGFQGEFAEKDKETGFTNFDLRMYSGDIGRWLAPDPYGQYSSPYVGMGADPVNSIDPDGGWSELASFALGAGIGAGVTGYIAYQNGARDSDLFWHTMAGAAAGGVGGVIAYNYMPNINFSGVGSGLSNAAGSVGKFLGKNAGAIGSAINGAFSVGLNSGNGYFYSGGHGFAQVSFDGGDDDFVKRARVETAKRPPATGAAHSSWNDVGEFLAYQVAGRIYGGVLGGVLGAAAPRLGMYLKATKVRKVLPSIDATGKVHGTLPKVQDFGKYSKDELKILLKELKQSVQQRIKVTSKMGRDRAHGQRQGAEHDLIKSLEKYLGE